MLTIFMVMAVVEGYSARAKRNPEKKNRGKRHLTVSLANHASAFRVFRADDTTSQCMNKTKKGIQEILLYLFAKERRYEKGQKESLSVGELG